MSRRKQTNAGNRQHRLAAAMADSERNCHQDDAAAAQDKHGITVVLLEPMPQREHRQRQRQCQTYRMDLMAEETTADRRHCE